MRFEGFINYFIIFTILSILCFLPSCSDDNSSKKGAKKIDSKELPEILFNETTQTEQKIDKEIIIVGASYAKGWNLAKLAGISVINKGVSGEQSFEILARFNRDVLEHNPGAVIIWGFINDIFRTKKEEIDTAVERVKASYEEMVLRSKNSKITPILATEVTIRPKNSLSEKLAGLLGRLLGKKSYQDYVNLYVLEINDWIREYARQQKLLLLDLQPVLSDKKGIRKKEYATDDGTHISQKGYEKLTDYAQGILEPISKKLK